MPFLHLATLIIAAVITAAGSCSSDEDCSLLGKCEAGVCSCNEGWTGPSCATADLEPLDTTKGYQNKTASSWGGRPVFDAESGRWQLFATEIKNKVRFACSKSSATRAHFVKMRSNAAATTSAPSFCFSTTRR